jgi:hypothetical protein
LDFVSQPVNLSLLGDQSIIFLGLLGLTLDLILSGVKYLGNPAGFRRQVILIVDGPLAV